MAREHRALVRHPPGSPYVTHFEGFRWYMRLEIESDWGENFLHPAMQSGSPFGTLAGRCPARKLLTQRILLWKRQTELRY